jgi:hypothetical protein
VRIARRVGPVGIGVPGGVVLPTTLDDHDVHAAAGELGGHRGTRRTGADHTYVGGHPVTRRDPAPIDQHVYRG